MKKILLLLLLPSICFGFTKDNLKLLNEIGLKVESEKKLESMMFNGYIRFNGISFTEINGNLYGEVSSIPTEDGLSGYIFPSTKTEIKTMKDYNSILIKRDECLKSIQDNEKQYKNGKKRNYYDGRPKS